jgi:hypothetical protein
MTELVRLKCVAEGKRLRVKIISKGYNSEANCQFPRDIRKDGCEYLVPVSNIKFSEMNCKFFYRISRTGIQIVDKAPTLAFDLSGLKIYGDDDDDGGKQECCICFSCNQMVVFAPCGHYCCCLSCANKVNNCPLCRARIQHRVTRDRLALPS